MRQRPCDVLEELRQGTLAETYKIDTHSLARALLRTCEAAQISDLATQSATRRAARPGPLTGETASDLQARERTELRTFSPDTPA
jgi:hypothetical protein